MTHISVAPRLALLLSLVGCLAPTVSSAQEGPLSLEFSFSNPGARSMGFGGAFVALADDATAAFSNPAGLVQLVRPEISAEGRGQGFKTALTGSLDGLTGVGFVSFVYPRKSWSLAVYRNVSANLLSNTRFLGNFEDPGSSLPRAFDVRSQTDYRISNTGVSGAYRVSERFSVGLGASFYEGSLESQRSRVVSGGDPVVALTSKVTSTTTIRRNDWAFSAGFLWRFRERWTLGGVARQGPEYGLRRERLSGPADLPPDSTQLEVREHPIKLPDVFGLGVAFKTRGGAVTMSFEWDRVLYSQTLDSVAGPSPEDRGFQLDDADEVHLGFEFVILRTKPVLAFRLGAWLESDHELRYVGADPVDRFLFPAGGDEAHFTAGVGLAFRSWKFDIGIDLSDLVDTGSLSLIYTF